MAGILGSKPVTRRRQTGATTIDRNGITPGATTDAPISVSWQPKVPADLLQRLDLGERTKYARFGLTRDDVQTADVSAGVVADLIIEGGDIYEVEHVDNHADFAPMPHYEFVAVRVTR